MYLNYSDVSNVVAVALEFYRLIAIRWRLLTNAVKPVASRSTMVLLFTNFDLSAT